jgi:hypothetical protein
MKRLNIGTLTFLSERLFSVYTTASAQAWPSKAVKF